MNIRAICEGRFTLPLRPESALELFTPEGERRWAGSSWSPEYAIPGAAVDDSAPGTVFTTESDGGAATWIVLERRDDGMRYARVAPGRIAGTITVSCSHGAATDETRVTVRYDVTSLGPEGRRLRGEVPGGIRGVPRALARRDRRNACRRGRVGTARPLIPSSRSRARPALRAPVSRLLGPCWRPARSSRSEGITDTHEGGST